MKSIKNNIKIFIAIFIGVLIFGLFLKKFLSNTGTICLVRGVIGIPCPSCGMTRAIMSFISGDVTNAFRYHPLFWLPFIFILTIIINKKVIIKAIIISATLLVFVYLYRMATLFPHTEPMNINDRALIKVFKG